METRMCDNKDHVSITSIIQGFVFCIALDAKKILVILMIIILLEFFI